MQTDLNDDLLLNRAEVEAYFGITKRFLEVSAGSGSGPPMIKIGRSVRYRVGDLRHWVSSRRVQSTLDAPTS